MSYLDRIVADSNNREDWLLTRKFRIGASDVAKFSKLSSVETYIRQKLTHHDFVENEYTKSGNRWEPMLLGWAEYEQNTKMFHHPDVSDFVCTPDGVHDNGEGVLTLAEIKTKHNKIVAGPTAAELRQIAWQLYCLPEAKGVDFIWGEVVDTSGEWELRRDPKSTYFRRDYPEIVAVMAQIVPIAEQVLAGLKAAQEFMKEVTF